jgi:hypothetical protein
VIGSTHTDQGSVGGSYLGFDRPGWTTDAQVQALLSDNPRRFLAGEKLRALA